MHKRNLFSKCNLSFLIILFILLINFVNAQLNTNGGFESSAVDTVSGTEIEGWIIEIDETADAIFQIVDDTVKHGSKALKVKVDTVGSIDWDIQVVADSIPVQQGETYHYSVWAKSSGSSQVSFTVGNYSNDEYSGIIRPTSPNVTTVWQEFAFDFTVTDAVDYIRAPIHFSVSENTGDSIYIDNLRIYNVDDVNKPVIVEAESGIAGSYFSTEMDGDITYITTTVDFTGQTSPEDSNRISTYQVTFPDSGYYYLYARVRVGSGGFDDDSFFFGRGLGEKSDTASADWVLLNGLGNAGFSEPSNIVEGTGSAGNQIWKWINATTYNNQGTQGDSFYVSMDSLTRMFQIASREDGLDFDKFAFGKSNLQYTVDNLDKGEYGSSIKPIWEGPPLASNQPKFVGNIYSASQDDFFELYWNQVTPENTGKWGSVESTRDVMNWTGLDAAYSLANDNDFLFTFSVLVWGNQQPTWIDSLSPEDQLAEITEWFQAVADRYTDIDYLVVVDSPLPGHFPPDGIDDRANYKEALGGDGDTGWDWVINAFQMAREIFPERTKLMINDGVILNDTSNRTQYLSLIRLLQKDNLIDVIGVHGHAFSTNVPVITMRRTLDSLATTGLPIIITEIDIDGPSDAIQLQDYQRIFPALYEHPAVEGITLWGWRPGLWRNDQGAYIMNQNYTERPALEWLRTYLDTVDVTSIENPSDMPLVFDLYDNYPNPFNPTTTIEFSIPQNSKVKLVVYNVLGQVVAEVLNTNLNAGNHEVTFNASNLSSGLYFYKLESGGFTRVKKMMVIK